MFLYSFIIIANSSVVFNGCALVQFAGTKCVGCSRWLQIIQLQRDHRFDPLNIKPARCWEKWKLRFWQKKKHSVVDISEKVKRTTKEAATTAAVEETQLARAGASHSECSDRRRARPTLLSYLTPNLRLYRIYQGS